jgi:hypothetical protein
MTSQRPLEYCPPAVDSVGRLWRWIALLLVALPWAWVLSVHLLYAEEWLVNGERPIPPFHGPDNPVEGVLYPLTYVLFFPFLASVLGGVLLPVVALAKGRRASLLLVLPGAAWALAIVTVLADPVHAFYFWLD